MLMPESPNLIFIFTDQQRADTLSCYGNRNIEAPNLNALSQRSFVFDNAYVSAPVCTPSRGTLLSGLWPHTHRAVENNIPLPSDVKTIVDLLPENYLKAYHGKWHLGDEVIRREGFDEWVSIEDQYRDYYSDERYDKVLSDHCNFLKMNGFEPDKVSKGEKVFSRAYAAAMVEEFTKAQFLATQAEQFIEKNKHRPFALYINIFEPHPPYDGPLNDLYDPAEIPVPPTFLKNPPDNASEMHKLRAEASLGGQGFDPDREVWGDTADEDLWRDIIARYWGNVTLVDRAVGRILNAVVQAGLQHNTIIVFTSEHGEQLGEFNIIQKTTFYESSIKVPMIVHVPWINNQKENEGNDSFSPIQRMSRIEGRYSHIDTVPTLLDLMGVEVPENLQGTSRLPVLNGEDTLGESDVFIDWPGDQSHLITDDMTDVQKLRMQPYRSIISREGWKLTLGPEQNEFYDLNEDVYEQNNLFDEVSEKSRIRDLTDRINQWQADTGDTAVLPQ